MPTSQSILSSKLPLHQFPLAAAMTNAKEHKGCAYGETIAVEGDYQPWAETCDEAEGHEVGAETSV